MDNVINLNVTELLEITSFINTLKEKNLSELEKFLNILYFYQNKLNRGLKHKEMVKLGVVIHKDKLKAIVDAGLIEKIGYGKDAMYKVKAGKLNKGENYED